MLLPYGTVPLSSRSQLWVRWGRVNFQNIRDLPTPGSPRTAAIWPWPLAARSNAWQSWFSAVSRATKRVSPYTAGAWSAPVRLPAPRTRPPAQRFNLDIAFGQPQNIRGDQNRARHRHLLHAGRQMRRLSHCRVVHMQVAADRADYHLAAIHPDPHLDGHALGALDLGGILFDRRLHGEGRIAGPHGMIFMRDRRAEEGHDAVTMT
jgi:hypothetical protein